MHLTAPVNHRTLPYKSNKNKSIRSRKCRKWTQEVPRFNSPSAAARSRHCWGNYTLLEKKKRDFRQSQPPFPALKAPAEGTLGLWLVERPCLDRTFTRLCCPHGEHSSVQNCWGVGLWPVWLERKCVIEYNPPSGQEPNMSQIFRDESEMTQLTLPSPSFQKIPLFIKAVHTIRAIVQISERWFLLERCCKLGVKCLFYLLYFGSGLW